MSHLIDYLKDLDIHLLQTINLERCRTLDGIFIFITHSATPVAYLVPCIILFAAAAKRSDLLRLRQQIFFIIFSLACSTIMETILKYSVNRPRPFITYPFIQKVTEGGSPSFPSGHTCDAFVIATCISVIYPRWDVILPFYCWALAVAYSRMDLGVHYPTDVLAGSIIGGASAYFAYRISKSKANTDPNSIR